jgi:Iron-containing redox enzyme
MRLELDDSIEAAAGHSAPVIHLAAPASSAHAHRAFDPRAIYHRLMNADAHPDSWALAAEVVNRALAQAESGVPTQAHRFDAGDAASWQRLADDAAASRSRWLAAWRSRIAELGAPHRAALLTQLAPSLAIHGCLLQHASSALNSHQPAAACLLRSYLEQAQLCEGFIDLLRRHRIDLPPVVSDAFCRHPELDAAMFRLPGFELALSQFPTVLLPELLGAHLHAALQGLHPLVTLLDESPVAPHHTEQLLQQAISAIEAASVDGQRLRRGFAAAQMLHAAREEALVAMAGPLWFSPTSRMARLLQRKAAIARGYHGRIRLKGQPFEAWFEGAAHHPVAALKALADSPHVVRGQPQRSSVFKALATPRGSMAGVFNAAELATISQWIQSLGDPPAHVFDDDAPIGSSETVHPPEPPAAAAIVCRFDDDAERRHARLPLRDLYWRLLHVETYPAVLPYARSFAATWLARAGLAIDKGADAIPFTPYDHQAFDRWLDERHRTQMASYVAGDEAAMPAREALIESCVQLCPMVYIDGAWLQRIGQAGLRRTEAGRRLYGIYLDEVGNPNLYRELMAAMDVQIPAFGSEAFAHWPGFDDASFKLPVLWLCISQFPRHFLSETLGLTLAVELSGVGSSYRSSSDALRHYGYPCTFVDVHNTIDNVSSGHTALAFDAIKLHLDEGLEQGGPDEVQRRWKRVWAGWRAIVPPAGIA